MKTPVNGNALADKLAAELQRLGDENEELRAEVELWKERCEAERQAHEATIKQCDAMFNER